MEKVRYFVQIIFQMLQDDSAVECTHCNFSVLIKLIELSCMKKNATMNFSYLELSNHPSDTRK